MEPGVHAGVSETLDTEHRLLSRAEHREGLIVKLTLNKYMILGHLASSMWQNCSIADFCSNNEYIFLYKRLDFLLFYEAPWSFSTYE